MVMEVYDVIMTKECDWHNDNGQGRRSHLDTIFDRVLNEIDMFAPEQKVHIKLHCFLGLALGQPFPMKLMRGKKDSFSPRRRPKPSRPLFKI